MTHGTFVCKLGQRGKGDGQFRHQHGVAVDGSGHIIVADSSNHRIQVFRADGTFVLKFGQNDNTTDNAYLYCPGGVAVDSSGHIIVAHALGIKVFLLDGTFVRGFGQTSSGNVQLGKFKNCSDLRASTAGVAVDNSGHIIVAHNSFDDFPARHCIQVFRADWTFVLKFGQYGKGDGQFSYPTDVAVDGSGNIIVSDLENRIQVFSGMGNPGHDCPGPAAQYTSFSYKALSAASDNFAATRLLGDGGFGKVYRCELPGTGLEVAIKVVPAGDADAAAHFEKEVKELSMHPHPNFVQLLGAAVDGPSLCLVMKYMKGGSVRSRLATQPPLSWRQRLEAATGAARGLVYLHVTLNKVHRDIKPSNMLVDLGAHTAVLCDFGLVRGAQTESGKTDRTARPVGTAAFMSHEAVKGKITPKMDIYAMGVTLLELATGKPAEGSVTAANSSENLVIEMEEAMEELEGGNPCEALAFLDTRLRAPKPPQKDVEGLLSLAASCLNYKYNQRPDAEDLLQELERLLSAADAAESSVPSHMMAMLDLSTGRELWCSTNQRGMDKTKLFMVDTDSDEFAAVAADFLKTLPAATIDRLDRIENGILHESFQLQASALQKQIGRAWDPHKMRRKLFHGTRAIEEIINSTDGHGFLPLLAGTSTGAMYGDGSYFARDAKYSDCGYAKTLPNGQKQMLVVDVLVGRSEVGKMGMKVCSLLPGEQYTRYNSLVDNQKDPGIIVIQHSNQAYPLYVITYHI